MSGSYSEHVSSLAACIRGTASNLEGHLQAGDDVEVDRHVLMLAHEVTQLVRALPGRFGAVGAARALDEGVAAIAAATGLKL